MDSNKKFAQSRQDLPILLSATDIQKIGLTRATAYNILNRDDLPVILIGGRKFVDRDKFFKWLDSQTIKKEK